MRISCNIGFFGLLTIALIVLKLCKVIAWSWWLVLSPIYVPIFLVVTFVIIWIWANTRSGYGF